MKSLLKTGELATQLYFSYDSDINRTNLLIIMIEFLAIVHRIQPNFDTVAPHNLHASKHSRQGSLHFLLKRHKLWRLERGYSVMRMDTLHLKQVSKRLINYFLDW